MRKALERTRPNRFVRRGRTIERVAFHAGLAARGTNRNASVRSWTFFAADHFRTLSLVSEESFGTISFLSCEKLWPA